jgi:hypothetical protein
MHSQGDKGDFNRTKMIEIKNVRWLCNLQGRKLILTWVYGTLRKGNIVNRIAEGAKGFSLEPF